MGEALERLLAEVAACSECAAHLPHAPRPVVRAGARARVLIVGQAPGRRVHATGVPWNDASGVRLRQWLGVDEDAFYDTERFALVPMGFCYPGKGPSGDLPPRSECAPLWHARLRAHMPRVRLTLLLSQYAVKHYLGERAKPSVAETVRAWREYAPEILPLPHPSPRNNLWLRRHPWFEIEVLPELRRRVREALGD
jgi:uracil-DNA glycosylase